MKTELLGLAPGTKYAVQVRAVNDTETSGWSQVLEFETETDLTPPPVPENFIVTAEGTAFLATWDRASDEMMVDFSHYELQIEHLPATFEYHMTQERFDFSYEMNVAAFGEPIGLLTMRVRAVDLTGNKSAWAEHEAVGNAAPEAVPNVTATAAGNAIDVKWGLVADTDIKHYNVYVHTGSVPTGTTTGTVVASTLATNFLYSTMSYSTDHYFSVRAVDVFNTTSETVTWTAAVRPLNYNQVDTVAPAVPGGLAATAVAVPAGSAYASIDVTWNAVAVSDLAGYVVRYSDTATSGPWSYVNISDDLTTTRIQNLIPGKTYYFQVRAYDFSANTSAFSPSVSRAAATDTNAPAAPTGLIGSADPTRISMYWDPVPNAASYVVEVHTNSTYTALAKTVTTTGAVGIIAGLNPDTNYYPRVRAESVIGTDGNWASPSPTLVKTPALGMTSVSFDDVTGELGTDRLFVIADTVGAEVLKAGTSFTEDLFVNATFTLGKAGMPDGIIKSVNYNQANGTGFSLSNAGLDIQQGNINARALRIQEGSNLVSARMAGFEASPSTYILNNSSGGNAVVTTERAKFESQSLRMSNTNAGGEYWLYLPDNINVEVENTYIFSVYAFSTVATAGEMMVQLSNGNHVGASFTTTANAWTRHWFPFTVPAGVTHVGMRLDVNTPNGVIWYDGLQVERQIGSLAEPSQWKPPGLTTVDGGIIRTGEIRSAQTTTIDGLAQPLWSLNTQGNMQINDAVVRGSMVLGASTSATSGQIQSWNYAPGSLGWAIKGDGSVEFRSGTFRGAVVAESLTISNGATLTGTISGGTTTGTHSGQISINSTAFLVDGSGNIGIGTGGTAISALNKFRVSSAGILVATEANISGAITATSLTIGAGATTTGTWSGSVTGPTSGTHSGPSTGTHSGVTTGTNQGTHTGPSTGTHSGGSTGTHSGTTTGTNAGIHTGQIQINGTRFMVDSNGAIGIGNGSWATHSSNAFRVDSNGNLVASNANVSGAITASSLNVSGATISGNATVSGILTGGTIQGATVRTALSGQWRSQMGGGIHGFVIYDDWNRHRGGVYYDSGIGQLHLGGAQGVAMTVRTSANILEMYSSEGWILIDASGGSNIVELRGNTQILGDLRNFNWGGKVYWHRNDGSTYWDYTTMQLRDDWGSGPSITFHHGGIRALSIGVEAGINKFALRNDAGTSYVGIRSSQFETMSDESLKEEITILEAGSLEKVKRVRPKKFKFANLSDEIFTGFVAQDLDEVGLATHGENRIDENGETFTTPMGYDLSAMISTLWQALRESEEEKDSMRSEAASTRASLASLQSEMRAEIASLKGKKPVV